MGVQKNLGVSLPRLESRGLSQAPAVSSGVFLGLGGRRGGRTSSALRLSGRPGKDASAGIAAAAGGEETARGCVGSSSRRPLSCLQTAGAKRKASILSLARPHAFLFFLSYKS